MDFQTQNVAKNVVGQGSALDLTERAYNVPPHPLVGWRGDILSPLDALEWSLFLIGYVF